MIGLDKFWSTQSNMDNPIAARNYICRSVCPKLYGMVIIKLGLLLTLIGGSSTAQIEIKSKDTTNHHLTQSNNIKGDINECDERNVYPEAFLLTSIGRSTAKENRNINRSDKTIETKRRSQSHLLLGKVVLRWQNNLNDCK